MSLARFKASNHPQQVDSRGRDDSIDDRATTADVFDPLHARYGFTVDVAAAPHNTKCARYWTREDNGLMQSWAGETVWCNPPYSAIEPWVRKAWDECSTSGPIVMLLPANRTEQNWWQDLVEPFRDRAGSPLTTEMLRGRIRFLKPGRTTIGPNERPPFGCCLLVWNATRPAVLNQLDFGGARVTADCAHCAHPATLTVTGLPGIRECTGCGVYLTERPDGTLERA